MDSLLEKRIPSKRKIAAIKNGHTKTGPVKSKSDKSKTPHQPESNGFLRNDNPSQCSNGYSIFWKSEESSGKEDWQFEGTFDSAGGTLRGQDSDVELEIPVGAVTDRDGVLISGAVFTDLEEIHSELGLSKTQHIASAVVEYTTKDPNFLFAKPVEIILPHLIPPGTNKSSMTVFQISQEREVKIQQLREITDVNEIQTNATSKTCSPSMAGGYYLGQNNKVHIFVDHFTAYCVAVTCEGVCQPEDLWLDLYAEHLAETDRRSRASVRLEIRNSRLKLSKDFETTRDKSANFQRLKRIDSKQLDAVDARFAESNVSVRFRLDLASNTDRDLWAHCCDEQGKLFFPEECEISLAKFRSCRCLYFTTPRTVQWKLTTRPESDVVPPEEFKCYVIASYVTLDQASSSTPPDQVTFSVEAKRINVQTNPPLSIPDSNANADMEVGRDQ